MPLGRRMKFDARGGRRAPRVRGQRSSSSAATRFWAQRRGRSRPGAVKRLFVGVNRSDAPVERGSGKNEGSRTVKSARSDVPRRPARLLRFERARADGFRAPREFKVLVAGFFKAHRARVHARQTAARGSSALRDAEGRHRECAASRAARSRASSDSRGKRRRVFGGNDHGAFDAQALVREQQCRAGRQEEGAEGRHERRAGGAPEEDPRRRTSDRARRGPRRGRAHALVAEEAARERRAHRRRTPRRGRARGGEGGAGEAGGEVRAGGGLEARQEQAQGPRGDRQRGGAEGGNAQDAPRHASGSSQEYGCVEPSAVFPSSLRANDRAKTRIPPPQTDPSPRLRSSRS